MAAQDPFNVARQKYEASQRIDSGLNEQEKTLQGFLSSVDPEDSVKLLQLLKEKYGDDYMNNPIAMNILKTFGKNVSYEGPVTPEVEASGAQTLSALVGF